jgi:hypothetical protein
LKDEQAERIDPQVLRRIASTSRATQRWLKTALQTIRTMPPAGEREVETPPAPRPTPRRRPEPPPEPLPEAESEAETVPPDLDDLLTGRRSLKEQLEARPELADELEGMADIIEMLRTLGEERRKRGEELLREEFLADEDEEPDEDV